MLASSMAALTPSDTFEMYPEAFDMYSDLDDLSELEVVYMLQTKNEDGGIRIFIFQFADGTLVNAGSGEVYDSILQVIIDEFELTAPDYLIIE